MKLKVKTITLFDRELQISERTAGDVIRLADLSIDNSQRDRIYQSAVALQDGLKINIKNLKWYQFIKKFQYKKILSKNYILDNLTKITITEFAIEILKLEGYKPEDLEPGKKKVVKEKI